MKEKQVADRSDHELSLAGQSVWANEYGFIADNTGTFWTCSCGAWRKPRNPRTGEPHREGATRAHRKHVRAVEEEFS